MRFLFLYAIFALGGLVLIVMSVVVQLQTEARYRRQFGADWRTEYDHLYGPGSLAHAHVRIAVAISALTAICAILFWFFWKNRPQKRRRSHTRRT